MSPLAVPAFRTMYQKRGVRCASVRFGSGQVVNAPGLRSSIRASNARRFRLPSLAGSSNVAGTRGSSRRSRDTVCNGRRCETLKFLVGSCTLGLAGTHQTSIRGINSFDPRGNSDKTDRFGPQRGNITERENGASCCGLTKNRVQQTCQAITCLGQLLTGDAALPLHVGCVHYHRSTRRRLACRWRARLFRDFERAVDVGLAE
jgi:hypothetical protein